MSQATGLASGETVVWDRFVRVGHWTLVVLFFIAYVTDGDLLVVHEGAGYGVAAIVGLRVLWGVVGTRHARFADFWFGPRAALVYLKDLIRFRAPRYLGHSPAGAWMVFALLIGLAATALSGMALLAAKENAGPLAGVIATDAPPLPLPDTLAALPADQQRALRQARRAYWKPYEDVHEAIVNLVLVLVVLHVGGVLLASVAHGENLVRSMITGRKRSAPDS